MKLYSLPEAADSLSVPYHKLYYAMLIGIVTPQKVGRARILTDEEIQILETHFERRRNGNAIRKAQG